MADLESGYRIVGIESIQMGNTPGKAAVSTNYIVVAASLTTISNIVPDSAGMIIDPETSNDFFVENKPEVDCQIKTTGKKYIEFATRDMGPSMLAFFLRGAASGASVWKAPTTGSTVMEKCARIVTKEINGSTFIIEIPRISITVGGKLKFGKTETGTLAISATIMQPYCSCAPWKTTLS